MLRGDNYSYTITLRLVGRSYISGYDVIGLVVDGIIHSQNLFQVLSNWCRQVL